MLFISGRILFAMLVASVAPVAARRPLDVVNRGPIHPMSARKCHYMGIQSASKLLRRVALRSKR